jgi:DNA-binding transcriptional LysR family regulator
MDNWDELRTAYAVARRGTVSGAAAALGVHHATVIRHVDALEARLGVKLFQRHARGYTPTEAGEELARVAGATDDQFAQLAAKLSGPGAELSGDLVVTALSSFTSRLVPLLAAFRETHPGVRLRYRTGRRLFRLEYGEAHVAVRAGNPPEEPDNVVQPLTRIDFALFAAPQYVARNGKPGADFAGHHFVGPDDDNPGSPLLRWTLENIEPEAIVFRASDDVSLAAAVRAGLGLGFLATDEAEGMVEILPPRPEWQVTLWLVTHVDLHRSAKVQALTRHLKAAFP